MFVITLYPVDLIVSHCDFGDFCAPHSRRVHCRYFYLGEEILAALPMAAIKLVSGAWYFMNWVWTWVCLKMMKHGVGFTKISFVVYFRMENDEKQQDLGLGWIRGDFSQVFRQILMSYGDAQLCQETERGQ